MAAKSGGDPGDAHEAGHDAHVGFWRNPKRFNVAVTRAKALLVVVGHPVVLMEVCIAPGDAHRQLCVCLTART